MSKATVESEKPDREKEREKEKDKLTSDIKSFEDEIKEQNKKLHAVIIEQMSADQVLEIMNSQIAVRKDNLLVQTEKENYLVSQLLKNDDIDKEIVQLKEIKTIKNSLKNEIKSFEDEIHVFNKKKSCFTLDIESMEKSILVKTELINLRKEQLAWVIKYNNERDRANIECEQLRLIVDLDKITVDQNRIEAEMAIMAQRKMNIHATEELVQKIEEHGRVTRKSHMHD